MKTPLVSAAVLVAALVLAAVLNPSAERHREKIREAIADRSPLAGALGLGSLAAFVSDYHPLGVASYTTVNGKTASIGLFGMVFVLDQAKR
jgi:hypothetical protein